MTHREALQGVLGAASGITSLQTRTLGEAVEHEVARKKWGLLKKPNNCRVVYVSLTFKNVKLHDFFFSAHPSTVLRMF